MKLSAFNMIPSLVATASAAVAQGDAVVPEVVTSLRGEPQPSNKQTTSRVLSSACDGPYITIGTDANYYIGFNDSSDYQNDCGYVITYNEEQSDDEPFGDYTQWSDLDEIPSMWYAWSASKYGNGDGGIRMRTRMPSDTSDFGNSFASYQQGFEYRVDVTDNYVSAMEVSIDYKVDSFPWYLDGGLRAYILVTVDGENLGTWGYPSATSDGIDPCTLSICGGDALQDQEIGEWSTLKMSFGAQSKGQHTIQFGVVYQVWWWNESDLETLGVDGEMTVEELQELVASTRLTTRFDNLHIKTIM